MSARRIITEHERLRRHCGYGVVELAKAVGYSHTYVSLVEAEQAKPSPRYRAAVAKTLGVPEHVIFGGRS